MKRFSQFIAELTDREKEIIKKRKEMRSAGKLSGKKTINSSKSKYEYEEPQKYREPPNTGDIATDGKNFFFFQDYFQVINHRDGQKSYGTINLKDIINHLEWRTGVHERKMKKDKTLKPLTTEQLIKDARNVYMLDWITMNSVYDIDPGKYLILRFKSDKWLKAVGKWKDYFTGQWE